MTRFAERLAAGELAVTLEITPPKKRLDEVLLRRARLLGSGADAVNVIQRRGRLSSLDASRVLREAGLEPVWHIVGRGRSRAEIASEIASAAGAGLEAALCIRGDHEAPDRPDTPPLREVVAMLRDGLPGALVGVSANQFGPRDRVLANLLPKLRAGAHFVQTNPVLELASFATLARSIREAAPGVKIVPMVMPLPSRAAAVRIGERLGVALPPDTLARTADGATGGWELFAETLEALLGSGLADGLAVMTAEMDAPDAAGARIAALLRDAALRGAGRRRTRS